MATTPRKFVEILPQSDEQRKALLRRQDAEQLQSLTEATPTSYAEAEHMLFAPTVREKLKRKALRSAHQEFQTKGGEPNDEELLARSAALYQESERRVKEIYGAQYEASQKVLAEKSPAAFNVLTPGQQAGLDEYHMVPPTPSQIVIRDLKEKAGSETPPTGQEVGQHYRDATKLAQGASKGQPVPEDLAARYDLNNPTVTAPEAAPGGEAWWETGLRYLTAPFAAETGAAVGLVKGAQQVAPADYDKKPVDLHATNPITGVTNVLKLIEQGLASASGVEIPLELDTTTMKARPNLLGVDIPKYVARVTGFEETPEVAVNTVSDNALPVYSTSPGEIILRNMGASAIRNMGQLNSGDSAVGLLKTTNQKRAVWALDKATAENPGAPESVVAAKAQQYYEEQGNADIGSVALNNPNTVGTIAEVLAPSAAAAGMGKLAKAAWSAASPTMAKGVKATGLHKVFSVAPEYFGMPKKAEDIGAVGRLAHDTSTVAQKEYQTLFKEPLENLQALRDSPDMAPVWDIIHTPQSAWTPAMKALAETPNGKALLENNVALGAARAQMRAKYPHLGQRIGMDDAGREVVEFAEDITEHGYAPHMVDERDLISVGADSAVDPRLVAAQEVSSAMPDTTAAAAKHRRKGTQPVKNLAVQWAHSIDSDLKALRYDEELSQMAKLGEEAGFAKKSYADVEGAKASQVAAAKVGKQQQRTFDDQLKAWNQHDSLEKVGIEPPKPPAASPDNPDVVAAFKTRAELEDFKAAKAHKYGTTFVNVGNPDEIVDLIPGTAGDLERRRAIATDISKNLSRVLGKPGEVAGQHNLALSRAMAERHIQTKLKSSAKAAMKETRELTKAITTVVQQPQRFFRTLVTLSPRVIKNNGIGAWWSNYVANGMMTSLNPAFNAKVMAAAVKSTAEEGPGWFGKVLRELPLDDVMNQPIRKGSKITVGQGLKAAQDSNAVNLYQLHVGEEALAAARHMPNPNETMLQKLGRGYQGATGAMAHGASKIAEATGSRATNELVDNYQKLTVFLGRLEGLDPVSVAKARDAVRKFGLDYSNIGSDAAIKEFFGFYSFMRQGLTQVAYLATEHPERLMRIGQVQRQYWRQGQGGSPIADDTGRRFLESPTPGSTRETIRKIREDIRSGKTNPNQVNFRDMVDTEVTLGRLESPLSYLTPVVSVAEMIAGKEAPDDVIEGLLGPLILFGMDLMQMGLDPDERDFKDRGLQVLDSLEKRFLNPVKVPMQFGLSVGKAAARAATSDKDFDEVWDEDMLEMSEKMRKAFGGRFLMDKDARGYPGNTRKMFVIPTLVRESKEQNQYVKEKANEGLYKQR